MARRAATLRWTAVAAVLFVLLWGIADLIQRFSREGQESVPSQWVLPVLVIAIVVLALGLAGVLIRNLVRLILDRRRGILGSRIRTTLVFFFLAFVLFPALVLFYGAAAVIRVTVEAMVKTPVEEVTSGAREIAEGWTESMRSRCRQVSIYGAGEAERFLDERSGPRAGLRGFAESRLAREGVDLFAVFWGTGVATVAAGGGLEREAARRGALEISRGLAGRAVSARASTTSVDEIRGGLMVQAAAPVFGGDGKGTPIGAVVVGSFVAGSVASRMDEIASSAEDLWRQFRGQRRDLLRLYRALVVLIFLATVFVATWIGFYLSRRITEPIEELAAATREIAAGNLGVRVRATASDEVGMLVDAFNEMAGQLQESREVIVRSTADLRSSNQALEDRRRYIEALLENLSTAVISTDRDGRVTTVNPAAGQILGLDLKPGDDLAARLSETGLLPLREVWSSAGRRGADGARRQIFLDRAGKRKAVAAQVTPLRGERGEVPGALLMVEDLTELLHAQRAAAWREVARRIAHEIKNPLTPIQLSVQRLRKKHDDGSADLPEVLAEATTTIEREVAALKGLVDEFSRFARMPEVVPRPVAFREIVESVEALYRGVPGMTWEIDISPEVGTVRLDAEQMRRALINLVDNAIAATGGEGAIRISARAHAGSGSLRIEVADTGPGIPEADRERMFLPYFSTKRRGTGLGLAIVHRVITDHQGTIRVEENHPRGARFVIEIPA